MTAGSAATALAENARIWLVALTLLATLVGARAYLAEDAVELPASQVPVRLRSAPHGDGAELANDYHYSDEFEVAEASTIELRATRTPADGILAIEVDLVPQSGPATLGADLFAPERMSVDGLRGPRVVRGQIRGVEPGQYRLRVTGAWVPQPGEGRTPQATLRSSVQAGSPSGFAWAALLLLLPALLMTGRWLLQIARARSADAEVPVVPAGESNRSQIPVHATTF